MGKFTDGGISDMKAARSSSCTERENLAGDAKGKGTNGSLPVEQGGVSSPLSLGQLGHTGRSPKASGRRQPSCDDTSRMNRELQVHICERLRAKLPGRTRQTRASSAASSMSGVPSTPEVPRGGRHFPEKCQTQTLFLSQRDRR
jgi:hypothetical protein